MGLGRIFFQESQPSRSIWRDPSPPARYVAPLSAVAASRASLAHFPDSLKQFLTAPASRATPLPHDDGLVMDGSSEARDDPFFASLFYVFLVSLLLWLERESSLR